MHSELQYGHQLSVGTFLISIVLNGYTDNSTYLIPYPYLLLTSLTRSVLEIISNCVPLA